MSTTLEPMQQPQQPVAAPAAAATIPNPYVGPRSYTAQDPEKGRRLYGRDRELQELLQLLVAERIVLLFSPSGAGKSSLINAALLPTLRDAGFRVLPVMRVALETSDAELREAGGFNRYVLSALMSLEEGRPESEQREERELAGMSLPNYLKERAAAGDDGDKPLALIFDQFEEILTLDPTDIQAKREFFAQAGEALRDPRHWALFSMREDYVASLDPFIRSIPTAFASTYRLDLLGEAAARMAIRKPAADRGVEFADDAARALVNDLRAVYVQQLGGQAEKRLGPHVDPVHLQVVCYRLWEKLPVTPETAVIGEGDLNRGGDVNDALAGYYSDSVAAVFAKGYAREREIRAWVGKHLITEQGVRGQVLRGEGQTQEMDNRVIDALIGAHLLRREERRGATWIELAHDRLIEPVRADNKRHRATLHQLQRQAGEWQQRNRPEAMLLRGEELIKANEWARLHADELTPVEDEFRKASNRLRARGVLITSMAVLCLVLMFVAVGLWLSTRTQKNAAVTALIEAEKAKVRAETAEKRLEALQKQGREQYLKAVNYQASSTMQVDDEALHRSFEFNDEYKKILSESPAAGRALTRVQYFYKQGDDPPEVTEAIRAAGFNFELRPKQVQTRTNFVRYGLGVNIKDVRLICYALLRAGVQLKAVGCFGRPAGKDGLIQIGGGSMHEGLPLVTAADINLLTECSGAATTSALPDEEP
jgi:hypothetical protein